MNIFGLFLASIVLILFYLAPTTVQNLDCGELLTNTYFWRTLHQPGYPLYEAIYWLFLHALPLPSLMQRASLLTMFLAMIPIGFLYRLIGTKGFLSFLLPLVLIAWPPFFRYGMIPDVFMLHLAIVSGIIYCYLCGLIGPLLILFALGGTNHHTTIFLLPIVLHAIFSYLKKNGSYRYLLAIGLTGLALFFGMYALLFTTDSSSLTSWQPVTSLADLFSYVIRSQYGSLSLTVTDADQSHFAAILQLFVYKALPLWPFFFMAALGFWRSEKRPQHAMLALTVGFYILIFCYLSRNLSPEGLGAEVFSRFFLMAGVMLAFLAASVMADIKDFGKNKRAAYALLGLILSSSLIQISFNSRDFDLQKNTLLETWTIDRLESVPKSTKPTVVLESADSTLFGLYYAQDILQVRRDLIILSPALMPYEWYQAKIKERLPDFKFGESILAENIDKINFVISQNFNDSEHYKITYLKLGRLIEKGRGIAFESDEDYSRLDALKANYASAEALAEALKIENLLDLWLHYSFFYLAQGLESYKLNDLAKAKSAFTTALKIVPFAAPAQANLCKIDPSQCLQ